VTARQLPDSVIITLRRHPLEGRELRVLGWMRRHGRMELILELPGGGRKRLIPAAHTSARAELAAGEDEDAGQSATLGKTADLLAASALIAAFRARPGGQEEQAARKPPAKEDDRAACPAQSAARPGSGATAGTDRPASRQRRRHGGHAAGGPDRQGAGSRQDSGGRR
jgi:hypothetical protein